jgi:hypothetical protein
VHVKACCAEWFFFVIHRWLILCTRSRFTFFATFMCSELVPIGIVVCRAGKKKLVTR